MKLPEGLSELESRLVQHVNAAHYQPVKPRVIARQLQIPRDELSMLQRTITVSYTHLTLPTICSV